MNEVSTWWIIANIAWGITCGAILNYFGLTAEWLIILTIFLGLDILFGLLDSYIVTQNTSSVKLVEWLAKKLTRWALPFIVVAAMKWVWYENIELLSNMIMSTLIISEWYSIIWHFYSINYGKSLPEIDALKALFEKVWELFKDKINND